MPSSLFETWEVALFSGQMKPNDIKRNRSKADAKIGEGAILNAA
jgi:hypothetical protein